MVTPEAVPVAVNYAGLGSRGIAQLFDSLIVLAIGFALLMIGAALRPGDNTAIALAILYVFFATSGYYMLFEGLWNGQTPGKRQQKIRVVKVDGQPIGWAQAVIRNLLRIVDELFYYAIGVLFILTTKKSQRLGDLAAGTIVLHEGMTAPPRPLYLGPPPPGEALRGLDTTGIGETEYAVVRGFLERRPTLAPDARAALAAQVAAAVRPRVAGGGTWPTGDEQFLEAVAHAYRARFGGGPTMPPPGPPSWGPGGMPPPPPPPQTS
jgi:uncharacterized RDD family membrane protein YckC